MAGGKKNKGGRPEKYSDEVAKDICQHIAGGKSLRSYCRENTDGPQLSTILRWVVGKQEFWVQYVEAREAAGFAHADRIVSIVDDMMDGSDTALDAQTARAAMDGLKWAAERMAPKNHMPQKLIDHRSGDGSMTPKGMGDFYATQDAGDD